MIQKQKLSHFRLIHFRLLPYKQLCTITWHTSSEQLMIQIFYEEFDMYHRTSARGLKIYKNKTDLRSVSLYHYERQQ